jgi:hypothetical protein
MKNLLKNILFLLGYFLCVSFAFGQEETIQKIFELDTVFSADNYLNKKTTFFVHKNNNVTNSLKENLNDIDTVYLK